MRTTQHKILMKCDVPDQLRLLEDAIFELFGGVFFFFFFILFLTPPRAPSLPPLTSGTIIKCVWDSWSCCCSLCLFQQETELDVHIKVMCLPLS